VSHSHAYVSQLLSSEWKPHSACENRTLRVKIDNVRVEITLVSVVLNIRAYLNHTACINYTFLVEIALCVYKSHWACRNHNSWVSYSHAYVHNNTRVCKITLCEWKLHFTCRNHYNVRVKITLLRIVRIVRITKLHSAGRNHTIACWSHTLRSQITLVRVWTSHLCVQSKLYIIENNISKHNVKKYIIADLFFWIESYSCHKKDIEAGMRVRECLFSFSKIFGNRVQHSNAYQIARPQAISNMPLSISSIHHNLHDLPWKLANGNKVSTFTYRRIS
jgi:hypothetical protein